MRYTALILCVALGGCVGTKITGRDTDTTKPYPSLHSVPDKPKPVDFTKIDAERVDFDKSHGTQINRNEAIRKNFIPPEKKSEPIEKQ